MKLKQREKNVVLVALLLQSIIKIWSSKGNERSWRFSHCITFHRTMRWCGHSFKPKAIIVVLAFLKVGFNNRKFSPGASNLITARRTNPTWLIFRLQNGKTKIFLNFLHKVSIKRFSVAFNTGTGRLLSTIDIWGASTYPTIIRWADLFWFRTSFSQLFPCWSSLTRHAFNKHVTPRVRVSLFDSFWLKPITQAAIYIPNIIGQI